MSMLPCRARHYRGFGSQVTDAMALAMDGGAAVVNMSLRGLDPELVKRWHNTNSERERREIRRLLLAQANDDLRNRLAPFIDRANRSGTIVVGCRRHTRHDRAKARNRSADRTYPKEGGNTIRCRLHLTDLGEIKLWSASPDTPPAEIAPDDPSAYTLVRADPTPAPVAPGFADGDGALVARCLAAAQVKDGQADERTAICHRSGAPGGGDETLGRIGLEALNRGLERMALSLAVWECCPRRDEGPFGSRTCSTPSPSRRTTIGGQSPHDRRENDQNMWPGSDGYAPCDNEPPESLPAARRVWTVL